MKGKRVAGLAGVKDATLKLSRNTYTTALLEIANVSTLAAQKIVGHANIETTGQHYFNPISEDVLKKVAVIDAIFEMILPKNS